MWWHSHDWHDGGLRLRAEVGGLHLQGVTADGLKVQYGRQSDDSAGCVEVKGRREAPKAVHNL